MVPIPMVSKATWLRKSFVALLTFVGFRPRVDPHVLISNPFTGERFNAEIAFVGGRQMHFKMIAKSILGVKCHWTLITLKGSCSRVRVYV